MSNQKKINIGIVAHVDAGKTSLTESILYASDVIKSKGNVDNGSTVTDHMELEKSRGITIQSSIVSLVWNDVKINIIDTPGHTDFSSEVDRVLSILDGVIIVVSAVDSIQAHTHLLWNTIKKMNIPCIFFINKIDRVGSDYIKVITDIHKEFNIITFPLVCIANEETDKLEISNLWSGNQFIQSINNFRNSTIEQVVELDDDLLNEYFDNPLLDYNLILKYSNQFILEHKIIPLLGGSAKFDIGISELLDAITQYIPEKKSFTDKLSAKIFKIENDVKVGKRTYFRLFSGQIGSKSLIYNFTKKKEFKTGFVKSIQGLKFELQDVIKNNDVGVIIGNHNLSVDDILGIEGNIKRSEKINIPVLTTEVKPENIDDYTALSKALILLNEEDPSLNLKWYKKEKEFHLSLIGPIQIEILSSILLHKFSIPVIFQAPAVIYKEMPIKKVDSYIRYWLPKPCWAIMTFLIEPGELNSGVIFKSNIRTSDIKQKFQNEIEKTVPQVLEQGIKGWEVTNIKITLLNGEDHEVHSRPGDFILATPMGILKGLEKSGTQLLEPILKFEIFAPEEYLGKITSDIIRMRGSFSNPIFSNNHFVLKGKVPVATSINYPIEMSSSTSGRGRIITIFYGHEPCPIGMGDIRTYRGVSPLDESKWILHRRGALKADERTIY